MSQTAVPFPTTQPQGYEWLDDEPSFDPALHLQLESPVQKIYLSEFGYSDEEISRKASRVGATSPFRILSPAGAEILLSIARRLRAHAIRCERIENMVRGGCYRSRWLRDLCINPALTDLMSEIYEVDVAAHTMPLHLGHMNFSPDDLSRAVDKWHHDTLPLDFVMMVTDPATLDGGQFEYFMGTKDEMAALAAEGKTPPEDRVVAPSFPGAGSAIALHGDMIVHRGAPLNKAAERISMVNGYVALDTSSDDQHRHKDLTLVDDPEALYVEWARHSAWRARNRLDSLINELEYTADRKAVAASLEHAIADVSQSIIDMRDDDDHVMHHYEKKH
ncbi:MAG: hypothetical protein KTR32_05945 [Granulosicoccus sp.]|nr:hypothetical protein [Granulosicoccus sp.]